MDEQPYDVHATACEIWNERTAHGVTPRRVLIAHSESSVGDSFALLLAMRGFEALQVGTVQGALRFAADWKPQIMFVDTRIGCIETLHDHALAKALRERALARLDNEIQMMIAFAADASRDPKDVLQAAGYDGFVRTPCPVWRMFDLLETFYAD
jgi:DNA-binding response OmpR family regulator